MALAIPLSGERHTLGGATGIWDDSSAETPRLATEEMEAANIVAHKIQLRVPTSSPTVWSRDWLVYTSEAADDIISVHLGEHMTRTNY